MLLIFSFQDNYSRGQSSENPDTTDYPIVCRLQKPSPRRPIESDETSQDCNVKNGSSLFQREFG